MDKKQILKEIQEEFNAVFCGVEMPKLKWSQVEHFVLKALKKKKQD